MLDSLVRVSRRVGKRPEEFVADRYRCRAYETTTPDTVKHTVRRPARDPRLRRVTRRNAHTTSSNAAPPSRDRPRTGRDVCGCWRRKYQTTDVPRRHVSHPEFRRPDSRALSVYPRTVSRTIELSLQSSFQLSLTVLVRYRSRGRI